MLTRRHVGPVGDVTRCPARRLWTAWNTCHPRRSLRQTVRRWKALCCLPRRLCMLHHRCSFHSRCHICSVRRLQHYRSQAYFLLLPRRRRQRWTTFTCRHLCCRRRRRPTIVLGQTGRRPRPRRHRRMSLRRRVARGRRGRLVTARGRSLAVPGADDQ